MALIKCPECEKEISDKADVCIHCGNPIHHAVTGIEGKVEIERTNKKWKKRAVWAIVLFFGGLIVLGKSVGFGLLLIFIALVVAASSRLGAWWTNG